MIFSFASEDIGMYRSIDLLNEKDSRMGVVGLEIDYRRSNSLRGIGHLPRGMQ